MGMIFLDREPSEKQLKQLQANGYKEISDGLWSNEKPETYHRVTLILVIVCLIIGMFFWRQHS